MRKKIPSILPARPSSADIARYVRDDREALVLVNQSTCLGTGAGGGVTASVLSVADGSWHKPVARKRMAADEWRMMVEVTEGFSGRLESGVPTPFLFDKQPKTSEYYAYMSRCEGGALSQQSWLRQQANDGGDKLAYYSYVFRELYRVLGFINRLHETKRVIHRDLKLENLLLDDKGHWLVADLGSALRIPAGQAAAPLPKSGGGLLYGTVYYNPLEMGTELPEPIHIGPEVDVWALGALVGALLPDGYHKSVLSWDELRKAHRPEHAAVKLVFRAMELNKPEPLRERAIRCETARAALVELAECERLTEDQWLLALSSLGDWMTAEKSSRPSCANIIAAMRPLMRLLPRVVVQTERDESKALVEITGLSVKPPTLPPVFPRLARVGHDKRAMAAKASIAPGKEDEALPAIGSGAGGGTAFRLYKTPVIAASAPAGDTSLPKIGVKGRGGRV